MLWLTHNDAELIGSNDPILIDEALLERRMLPETVSADLKRVMMGTAREFLSYFVLGTEGLQAFSRGGTINTDDNLFLEFSAPLSVGINMMRKNAAAITAHRESILPYLRLAADGSARAEQQQWWLNSQKAARVYDMAHAIFLGKSLPNTPQFVQLMKELDTRFSWFAPGRFLKNEYLAELYLQPRLMDKIVLTLTNDQGGTNHVEISAVLAPISKERAAVVFVNNAARVIYGQIYIDGLNRNDFFKRLEKDVMSDIHKAYQEEVRVSLEGGKAHPSAKTMTDRIRKIIAARAQMERQPSKFQ
jgi:spermidine synthase